jgi:hypothetical protein
MNRQHFHQSSLEKRLEVAAGRVYDYECACHAAHQAGVDIWTKAAADKLHGALLALEIAEGEAGHAYSAGRRNVPVESAQYSVRHLVESIPAPLVLAAAAGR